MKQWKFLISIVICCLCTFIAGCEEEKSATSVICNFDFHFSEMVVVRSQQDNKNLCEAPARTVVPENGTLEFVGAGDDEILVWLEDDERSEVWGINFMAMNCRLALPFPPNCPSTTDGGDSSMADAGGG